MIEYFREKEFISKLLKKVGLYNNGNFDNKYLDLINISFEDVKYENTINLSSSIIYRR